MKISTRNTTFSLADSRAFSMVEVLVALAIAGIAFVSLYAGLSSGYAVMQLARENLRATQILQEKMETIRLYTWDQINTPGFIPADFTDVYYSSTGGVAGLTYTGTVAIASAPIAEAYNADLKMVTLELNWVSANVPRKREMQTFVSRYGIQNYVYY